MSKNSFLEEIKYHPNFKLEMFIGDGCTIPNMCDILDLESHYKETGENLLSAYQKTFQWSQVGFIESMKGNITAGEVYDEIKMIERVKNLNLVDRDLADQSIRNLNKIKP